jgi:hypothetical protein
MVGGVADTWRTDLPADGLEYQQDLSPHGRCSLFPASHVLIWKGSAVD